MDARRGAGGTCAMAGLVVGQHDAHLPQRLPKLLAADEAVAVTVEQRRQLLMKIVHKFLSLRSLIN